MAGSLVELRLWSVCEQVRVGEHGFLEEFIFGAVDDEREKTSIVGDVLEVEHAVELLQVATTSVLVDGEDARRCESERQTCKRRPLNGSVRQYRHKLGEQSERRHCDG